METVATRNREGFVPVPGLVCDTAAAACAAFAADSDTPLGQSPRAVIKPRDGDEVFTALQWANAQRVGLVPVSSTGQRRRGDTVPQREGLCVLDLSGMNRLLHADGGDRVAVIEPGVDFGTVDRLLAPHGLRAFRPLMPRAGKSVVASYLEREPLITPNEHWDVEDPFGGTHLVLGNGRGSPTGSAAIEGTLAQQWAKGHRHMVALGPSNLDLLRVVQGAQGTLAVMSWATVYCERIPAQETAWFAGADALEPVLDFARELLFRRLGNALFIVDRVQLALMLAPDRAAFDTLLAQLPAWTAFVSVSANRHQPAAKMAWQTADVHQCAARHGVALHDACGTYSARGLILGLRQSAAVHFRDRAFGAHRELFFVQQMDRAARYVQTVRSALDAGGARDVPLGVYLQPMAQGVNCHIEFTWAGARGDQARREADPWHVAALRCAEDGAFFSRPYGRWADLAYERDAGGTLKLMRLAKSLLDPNGLMNPGRLPY